MSQSEYVAVIGLAGRFPGADDLERFWGNLRDGVESVRFFPEQELLAAGVDPAALADPRYVRAKGALTGVDRFDAEFFGLSPREAAITDPQHRLFLECAWEALEIAGYDPESYPGRIGVFGGAGGIDTYLRRNLSTHADLGVSDYQLMIGNDKDFLCTRVSYKLGLKGPSLTVQTACSTSLVAVATACQSLRDYQCDLALAGAAAISLPVENGYRFQEGMILSPDGHCRPFDADAAGTVSGNGVGLVLLKRLEEALADGDTIRAVIRGWAVNNDGAAKAGFTAPSVDGQAEVIAEALALAEVAPETIGYVEAHGTGTPLGDPIELAALTQGFLAQAEVPARRGYCAVGSVKANLGHLDVAGGVAGLIKTVLCLEHREIPPHLHFRRPNPQIDFVDGPFRVNTRLSPWRTDGHPRRAGVSSFGIGGTNAHLVLEEAPPVPPAPPPARRRHLLTLSARTPAALAAQADRLADHLRRHGGLDAADVAYTLQVGRRAFPWRRTLSCATLDEAAARLATSPEAAPQVSGEPAVAFLFPGQGSQYVDMGRHLYHHEPGFRDDLDRCARLATPHLGFDLRRVLFSADDDYENAQVALARTDVAQPALFAFEYALARLWMSWGIRPRAMVGHSLGEYVAACLADVMTLEEGLALVAARGRLCGSLPHGAMLAVALDEARLLARLPAGLSVAAVNAPSQCVVSGAADAVTRFADALATDGIDSHRLAGTVAFHSPAVAPIRHAFGEVLRSVRLQPPGIPYLSNVTGTWIEAHEATDPDYWLRHLEQPVRFADGLGRLLDGGATLLLEVGPGQTLTNLARRHPAAQGRAAFFSSLPAADADAASDASLLETLGGLWSAGVEVDWQAFHGHERRRRVPLPTYPFERQRHWIDPARPQPRDAGEWEALLAAGTLQAQAAIAPFEGADYREKKQALEALCAAYVNRALVDLNAFTGPSERLTAGELRERCAILPRYRQLLPRCLDALVGAQRLRRDGDRFHGLLPADDRELAAVRTRAAALWADTPAWIELIGYCGTRYAQVLTGRADPRELLFTGSAYETLKTVYGDSPESHYFNGILRALVRRLAAAHPHDATLRVLEIGAGTGSSTAHLLPELPSARTRYTYTDVGPTFLSEARRRFAAYDFVDYRSLDIERPPGEQGIEAGVHDLVIAANVLHATCDLSRTLTHARSLLAPGGTLLLIEITRPELLFFDVAFPIMEPYDETDPLRDAYPFLTRAQWHAALLGHGFDRVASLPEGEPLEDHVIVARAAAHWSSARAIPAADTEEHHGQVAHATSGRPFRAPRDGIERTIAELWQKYLGITRIGIDDDFFDLGGDSLIAVQLASRLHASFDVPMSSHALLKAPTVAELARMIASSLEAPRAGSSSQLITLQRGDERFRPLFLVHPAGGHVYMYRELTGYLDPRQPVYGIQAAPFETRTPQTDSVESLADRYVQAIRTVQPEGPYALGGASFGGLVALEIARRLDAAGQRTELLAVIDSPCPGQLSEASDFESDLGILCYLLRVGDESTTLPERIRQIPHDSQIDYFLEHCRTANRLLGDTTREQVQQFLNLFKRNLEALKRYLPSPYSGSVVYFRAREDDPINPVHREQGWHTLALGGLDVIHVPGNHITMNHAPNVAVVADEITRRLSRISPTNE